MASNWPGLQQAIVQSIQYDKPTAIQRQAIPAVLQERDVIAAAQTGTGKTAAFVLPLLQLLSSRQVIKQDSVRALILTPTRELAAQVHQSVCDYGKQLTLTSCVIFGGVKINPQIRRLKAGADIVIATPGRLLDLVNQGHLDLSFIEILVLDEADRMLDMGFIRDIKRIISHLPKRRQNLLFSATFSKEIKSLASKLLYKPIMIGEDRCNVTADHVKQCIYRVDKARKRELISYLIGSENWQQVLIFTRTKHGANRLAKQLDCDGLPAAAIHGNKSQGARTRALAGFKAGDIRVLVATDIAARGLDIDKLPHVVNFELPNVPEDYVHRIGRTGRAENSGLAISLVSAEDEPLLFAIEKVLKRRIESKVLAGYEPKIKAAQPVQSGKKNSPSKNAGQRKRVRNDRSFRRNKSAKRAKPGE